MRRILVACLTVAALTGCSGQAAEDTPKPTPTTQADVNAAEDPTIVDTTWGKTYDYGDGITITVEKPEPYVLEDGLTWSEEAADEDHMLVAYTVTNNTGRTLDTSTFGFEGEDIAGSERIDSLIPNNAEATGTALLHVDDAASMVAIVDFGDGRPKLHIQ